MCCPNGGCGATSESAQSRVLTLYISREWVKFIYEGNRIKVKVLTGSTKVENSYSNIVKPIQLAKTHPVLHVAWGFSDITTDTIWCERHLNGFTVVKLNTILLLKLFETVVDM